MRLLKFDILFSRAGALAGLAMLSLLSACASTMPPARDMTLGAQAPAPMGYLEFCARRPDQCGLPQVTDASGAPMDAERRAQDLRRRYYWQVALAGAASPQPAMPSPASGGVARLDQSPFDPSPWRGGLAADSLKPRLDPATWSGGAASLLQPAVLVTPQAKPALFFPQRAPASQNLFQPPAAPAPSDRAEDPLNLHDADADAPRAVQPVAATPETMAVLNAVNRNVNRSIRYASARALYGSEDYWTLPLDAGGLKAGDCKDYVLEKRKALVEQGLPAGDLSIAVVMLRTGVAHAVLLVATDHGEVVMDSLSSWIVPWNQLDYRWISRQAPGQQLVWVKVEAAGRG
jgi:predicted transglutaminase-like cysteine proteinase